MTAPTLADPTPDATRLVHPPWCPGDPVGCDIHLGAATVIPATGGRHHNTCDGVAYPAVQVAPATTVRGGPGVFLSVLAPGPHATVLRPEQVRAAIDALTQALAVVEGGVA